MNTEDVIQTASVTSTFTTKANANIVLNYNVLIILKILLRDKMSEIN